MFTGTLGLELGPAGVRSRRLADPNSRGMLGSGVCSQGGLTVHYVAGALASFGFRERMSAL